MLRKYTIRKLDIMEQKVESTILKNQCNPLYQHMKERKKTNIRSFPEIQNKHLIKFHIQS